MRRWLPFSMLVIGCLLLTGCVQDWAGRATPAGSTAGIVTLTPTAPTGELPSATPSAAPPSPTVEPATLTPLPPTLTPAPPTQTPQPLPVATRLEFPAGGTTLVAEGVTRPGAPNLYVLRALAGQILDVELSLPMAQAELAIWGADGTFLKRAADGRLWWRGTLPSTQDYYLQVAALGAERGYSLSIGIPVRIAFAQGATSARVEGSVEPAIPDLFILQASAGQTMKVAIDSPSSGTTLEIWGFDGTILKSEADAGWLWIGPLPSTQDYFVYVYNWSEAATYRLDVAIPAGDEQQPVRVSFASGATSATLNGSLAALGQDVYMLGALADQVLDVQLDWSGSEVLMDIWGEDGTVLKHAAAGGGLWRDYLPSSQDYYVGLTAPSGAADYTLRVSIPARISFAPGAVSATVPGWVESRGSVLYILRAGAGQEMEVELEAGPDILPTIWGYDGTVLKRYVDGQQTWRGVLPSTQDYFVDVGSFGAGGTFSLTVTVR